MTAYRDWFSDFPNRTLDVLQDLKQVKNGNLWRKRSVTILLMTACSGFVIPFERLDRNRADDLGQDIPNEAKGIRAKLKFEHPFIESIFVTSVEHWLEGHVPSIEGAVDSWLDVKQTRPLAEKWLTKDILCRLRNALAHGTVWTSPANLDQEIRKLVFVERHDPGKPGSGFDFIILPIHEFEHFLKIWLEQLSKFGSNVYALPLKAA